jgi:hypothetical protein
VWGVDPTESAGPGVLLHLRIVFAAAAVHKSITSSGGRPGDGGPVLETDPGGGGCRSALAQLGGCDHIGVWDFQVNQLLPAVPVRGVL